MLKVAVVGVGGISGAHIPAWDSFDDVELVALCDIRPEQMEQYENKALYTDFDQMLETEELDIVDICLPTYLHADFAVKAMEKGIHVVCEKPISLNFEDVKRVYDTAQKNNVKFMVAQVLRFWPEYEFVKELIDTKKYGELISANMQRLGFQPNWSWDGWMTDENRSGLVPFDLHIHDLDFLVYALGKPNKVNAFRAKRTEQDVLEIIYDFGGAIINCEATWYAGKIPFNSNFRFQFEKAVVIYNAGKLNVYLDDGTSFGDSDEKSEEKTDTLDLPKTNAYANELRYFADCVINNNPCDKVKSQELETVIKILKSF